MWVPINFNVDFNSHWSCAALDVCIYMPVSVPTSSNVDLDADFGCQ